MNGSWTEDMPSSKPEISCSLESAGWWVLGESSSSGDAVGSSALGLASGTWQAARRLQPAGATGVNNLMSGRDLSGQDQIINLCMCLILSLHVPWYGMYVK